MAISSSSRGLRPGVCTSTTRPSNPYDGMVIYETDTDKVAVYDVNAWVYKTNATAPALVLVKTQTIGTAVSSVTVSDAFSATYDNYKIIVSGGASSVVNTLQLQLGSTTTGYYSGLSRVIFSSSTQASAADNNAANFARAGGANASGIMMNSELLGPNLAKNTYISGAYIDPQTSQTAGNWSGFLNDTTAYTAFTIIASNGTFTGGTIRVYGYLNT